MFLILALSLLFSGLSEASEARFSRLKEAYSYPTISGDIRSEPEFLDFHDFLKKKLPEGI